MYTHHMCPTKQYDGPPCTHTCSDQKKKEKKGTHTNIKNVDICSINDKKHTQKHKAYVAAQRHMHHRDKCGAGNNTPRLRPLQLTQKNGQKNNPHTITPHYTQHTPSF